ncbi:thiamine pyrophosphate-dependent enzyme, partial [Streptomyces sp. NPDC047097]|uniref:thiamine pyrophosphate-dependent enzyme n=1 Tax=Streptomyces sp. NPDC047097 TaxID=3155260 RepID=UPI0033DA8D86
SSEVNFDTTHPLYGGALGHMSGDGSAAVVGGADAVLIVGTYVFPEVFPRLHSPFGPAARIVHIDADAYEIAKNFPVDLGIAADPKASLGALAEALDADGRPPLPLPERGAPPAAQPASLMDHFARELAERAPGTLAVFDEALTASDAVTRHLPPREPGRYFQTRGGSLGVGIPGALGLKLARPGLEVVGFTGDGGSMYTIQALWTAARYDIAAKFVICNNGRYQLLDDNLGAYRAQHGSPALPPPQAFDLSRPDIRFTELAGALGVPGTRVEKPDQVGPAVEALLSHPGPFLVDLLTA